MIPETNFEFQFDSTLLILCNFSSAVKTNPMQLDRQAETNKYVLRKFLIIMYRDLRNRW